MRHLHVVFLGKLSEANKGCQRGRERIQFEKAMCMCMRSVTFRMSLLLVRCAVFASLKSHNSKLANMFGTTSASANPNNDLELPGAPGDSVSCLRWSPTANLLAASSWDKSVGRASPCAVRAPLTAAAAIRQTRVWQVEASGSCDSKFHCDSEAPVVKLAWAADGKCVLPPTARTVAAVCAV